MSDPMRNFIERFPENKEVIRELEDTNSTFVSLCEEYEAITNELDALMRSQDATAAARERVLRERRMTVEEKMLTVIEGYQPA